MITPLSLTFIILLIAMVLFLSDRVRVDVVALLIVVALGVTGILTPEEAFSGFSRSAAIAIISIFILAEGLNRAGLTDMIGNLLIRLAGKHENRLIIMVMLGGAVLSMFMNTIAAAAVLLQGVIGAARKAGIHPGRLLMPLAFGTLLGGMATLLTSTNIVVSSILQENGLAGFGVLEFAPVGLPMVALGVAYMALWGRRAIPARGSEPPRAGLDDANDLADLYNLQDRLFRARIPAGSYLIGRPLAESTFREIYNLSVVGLERAGTLSIALSPSDTFQEGDMLILEGRLDEFREKDQEPYLEILPKRSWREQDLETPGVIMIEAVLSPRSGLIGKTLQETHFRDKYEMTVLAIWRNQRPIRTGINELRLQFGDALLMIGPPNSIPVLQSEPDLIVLADGKSMAPPSRWKRIGAAAIMLVTLASAAFNPGALGEVLLAGALGMVLLGMLSMDEAYAAIDWRSVFLVVGVLPLGVAMTKTGAAELLTHWVINLLGNASGVVLLAGVFILATLLTQAMAGVAVGAVLAPIAINVAHQFGYDPRSLAMAVALGTSMAFLTPLGHPVNILVMAPGGYRFGDYLKVGLPLTLLLLLLVTLLLPMVWPLQPI
jgi:di/tricarboxylate transporter